MSPRNGFPVLLAGLAILLKPAQPLQRIITLAPALTEMVYALEQGAKIVANTRYCDFPESARKLPHIGGYLDLNREALLGFNPDLIIHYPEHRETLQFLQGRVRTLEVAHNRLSDILNGIRTVGRALGVADHGHRLANRIQGELDQVAREAQGKPKPTCLFILGRNRTDLRNMVIMGKSDFINDILTICGGVNVYQGEIPHPSISLESISQLAPELICEISSAYEGIPEADILRLWSPYTWIPAVARKRIAIISDSAWLRPGPRIAEMARQLSRILHHDHGR